MVDTHPSVSRAPNVGDRARSHWIVPAMGRTGELKCATAPADALARSPARFERYRIDARPSPFSHFRGRRGVNVRTPARRYRCPRPIARLRRRFEPLRCAHACDEAGSSSRMLSLRFDSTHLLDRQSCSGTALQHVGVGLDFAPMLTIRRIGSVQRAHRSSSLTPCSSPEHLARAAREGAPAEAEGPRL